MSKPSSRGRAAPPRPAPPAAEPFVEVEVPVFTRQQLAEWLMEPAQRGRVFGLYPLHGVDGHVLVDELSGLPIVGVQ